MTVSRLGILVAAGLGLVAIGAGLVTDMPDVAGALRELVHALGPWTYAVVAALVLLEAMAILGLVSPGEAVLAVGGAAAAHGAVELPAIIAAAWAAAVVGDATGFWLGRRYGRALLVHTGRHVGICAERLARLERLILRWGGAALVGGRFVGVVRAFTPFLAGASGMPLRRVIGFSIAGAGAWCAAFIVAGYLLRGVAREPPRRGRQRRARARRGLGPRAAARASGCESG